MQQYQKDFINFMLESDVLRFGNFTLKSGRKSPFFMNAGLYQTGAQLNRLGEFYAQAIREHYGLEFDVLFGPAYKGIPLAVATVMAISRLYGKDIRYCSNRKEVKDHGDKGILLGAQPRDGDRVVIIEDVTTSGASMAETVPILRAQADVNIIGLIVSLNRMEVGMGGRLSALDEIREKYGFETNAIVSMRDVIEYLGGSNDSQDDDGNRGPEGSRIFSLNDEMKKALTDYYERYGAESAGVKNQGTAGQNSKE